MEVSFVGLGYASSVDIYIYINQYNSRLFRTIYSTGMIIQ